MADGGTGRRQLLIELPRIVGLGRYLSDNVISDRLPFVACERLAQPAHDLDRLRERKGQLATQQVTSGLDRHPDIGEQNRNESQLTRLTAFCDMTVSGCGLPACRQNHDP